MIKKNCVRCDVEIPTDEKYHDNYGNWCVECNRRTGFYYRKDIQQNMTREPLETETIRRLKLKREARTSEKLTNQIYQPAESEYLRLEKKVAEETRMLEIEKAQAKYTDLEIL